MLPTISRAACLVLAVLLTACGRGTNAGDGAGSPTAPTAQNTVGIQISINCFASECAGGFPEVTFTFLNQTRSTSANASFEFAGVPPGIHEVSGRFTRNIDIGVGRPGAALTRLQPCPGSNQSGCGGAVPGSLESLEGPVAQIRNTPPNCFIQYATISSAGNSPQTFRLRFTVDTSVMPSC